MAAGFRRNGSALNTKEPDSAITTQCDPRTETETVTWENRILLLNGSIIRAGKKYEHGKRRIVPLQESIVTVGKAKIGICQHYWAFLPW